MAISSTSFKPGNQMALGHGFGRPRTVIPEDDELIELGKKMVEYFSEPTKEVRCMFSQWYTRQGFKLNQWKQMITQPVFQSYHEQARMLIATNHTNGTINPSIAHRFLRHYAPEVKEEENEELEHKANLNKPISSEPFDNVIRSIAQALKGPGTVPGTSQPFESKMEDIKPLLDQGQAREQDTVSS